MSRYDAILTRLRLYARRFRRTFHVSLMPTMYGQRFYVSFETDDYGDFVIWIGRVWIAASWSDSHPWEGDLA